MTGPVAAPADGLQLHDVELLEGGGVPQRLAGVRLTIDRRGVVLIAPGTDAERVLRWDRIVGWQVEPTTTATGAPGALIVYRTETAAYRFAVAGADPGALGYLVEQLGHGYRAQQARAQAAPPPAAEATAPPAGGIAGAIHRLQPVLVVALVVLLVAAVTLILLQSAGVIHIPLLGGNSNQPFGAPAAAAPPGA